MARKSGRMRIGVDLVDVVCAIEAGAAAAEVGGLGDEVQGEFALDAEVPLVRRWGL